MHAAGSHATSLTVLWIFPLVGLVVLICSFFALRRTEREHAAYMKKRNAEQAVQREKDAAVRRAIQATRAQLEDLGFGPERIAQWLETPRGEFSGKTAIEMHDAGEHIAVAVQVERLERQFGGRRPC